jgi:hypothetical protein
MTAKRTRTRKKPGLGTSKGDQANIEDQVRKFCNALIPAVDDKDLDDPVVQESHQVLQEARDLVRQLKKKRSSWDHILDELKAWSHDRPLPVMTARKKSMGIAVSEPDIVAHVLLRSGIEV